jgi:hypothetical protein
MIPLTPLTRFFLCLHGIAGGWTPPCGPSVILAVLGRLDCALSRPPKWRRAGVRSSEAGFTLGETAVAVMVPLAGVVAMMRIFGVAVSRNQGQGRLAVQTATYCQNQFLRVPNRPRGGKRGDRSSPLPDRFSPLRSPRDVSGVLSRNRCPALRRRASPGVRRIHQNSSCFRSPFRLRSL